jgi:hypothetical protein
MEVWRGMARDVRGIPIPHCGQLPHEEQPEVVNRAVLEFLQGWEGKAIVGSGQGRSRGTGKT